MSFVGRAGTVATNLLARTTIIGAQYLPHSGPAFIVANHTTMADPVLTIGTLNQAKLLASPPCGKRGCGVEGPDGHGHVRVMATELVFNNPVTRSMVTHAGMIPAGFKRPSPESVRPTLSTIEAGGVIFMYPEGDVAASGNGAPRPFRPGLAWLLRRAPARVIPFAHHDSRRVGSGQFFHAAAGALTSLWRWPDITFVVGKPIEPEEFADLSAKDLTALVSDRLYQAWDQARHFQN
jgi:1-acyl-sn-glycerol-3-phosphate acyltransferase